MATESVRYHRSAVREAREARDWFADRDPSTVERFQRRLSQAEEQLRAYPDSGRGYLAGTRLLPLRPFPYAVVYTVEVSHILILAVVHTARRDDYWLKRRAPPKA